MLWVHRLRLFPPTPPLTHLRFDGILLCEAHRRCRDRTSNARCGTKGKARCCATWLSLRHEREANGREEKDDLRHPPSKRIHQGFVTEDERAELVERAAQAGMSQSAFLRAVGLNEPIRSVVDLQAVADLGKVNGDLGRVAGLLKLWLAEKRGQGARPVNVEAMMNDFRRLQGEVLAIMARVIK